MSAQGPFKELDVVRIPESVAAAHRVRPTGTIVWHVSDAPYATVECARLDDNEDGLKTELVEVDLADLEKLCVPRAPELLPGVNPCPNGPNVPNRLSTEGDEED